MGVSPLQLPLKSLLLERMSRDMNKALTYRSYPTEPGIIAITSELSKVLVADTATSFLLGNSTLGGLHVTGNKRLDVSAWVLGSQMLVSIVNLEYGPTAGNVTVALPAAAAGVSSVLWGTGAWEVANGGLSLAGMAGLQVDLLVLDL